MKTYGHDIQFLSLQFSRRYRDKERTESQPTPAATATTPRATTPSETKKSTINVTVNPKSLSSNQLSTKSKNISKKIDMGAATNFGRDELGVNSPTHRNTHAEEDLFATSNITNTSTANKSDLDDIFKTCSTANNLVSNPVSSLQSNNDDDFFNPRADESQEFGDFASAFGTSSSATTTATVQSTTQLPQEHLENNTLVIDNNDTKKNEFADFSSAFDSNHQTSSNTNNDPANLLFAINSTSNAQTTASNSNQKVGDLLSDLDGLSLNVSVPTGKLITFSKFFAMYFVFFFRFWLSFLYFYPSL